MLAGEFDLIVIGEGIAGLTAARQAAAGGIRVATFEARLFGGLVTNVNVLDPAPDPTASGGAEFAASLLEASVDAGVKSIQQQVTAVEPRAQGFFVRTAEGDYYAGQLIVASGARFRPLGIPGEAEFAGRGVSNCADCDGPLYQRSEVVVAGGGDSALQEALVLGEFCARVYIVHHGAALTGRADLAARVASHARISTIADAELERIDGTEGVERVTIRKRSDGSRSELPCRGVFAYVGLMPNSEFLPAAFQRDHRGCLVTDGTNATLVPGAFAVGAVRVGYGGTLIDAIRDGAGAAQAIVARATPSRRSVAD